MNGTNSFLKSAEWESPFTNLTIPEPESYPSMEAELLLESPLLNPEELEKPKTVGNPPAIDLVRAVRENKKYQQQLWTNQVPSILAYFASKGIIADARSASPENFAQAVAKWQTSQFTSKQNIDGILGPNSWKILKPLLVRMPSRWEQIIKDTVQGPAIPLVHGKETYEAMVAAIRTAVNGTHYIYILGWMLDVDFEMIPGDPKSTLYSLLKQASEKGVEIRILIWDNPIYVNENTNALKKLNALNNSALLLDDVTFGSQKVKNAVAEIKRIISVAPSFLSKIDAWNDFLSKVERVKNEGSHHEKVLIVKGMEGLIGFCGGIDINTNRLSGVDDKGRSKVLHDIHCQVYNYAAWVLLHRFIWRWQVYKSAKAIPVNPYMFVPLRGEPEPKPVSTFPLANTAAVKVVQTYNHPTDLRIKDRSIRETVKAAIMNARESVHLEDQYMISLEIASWLNLKLKEPGFKYVSILTQDDSIAKEDLLFPKDMRGKFISFLTKGLDAATIKQKVFINMLDPDTPPLLHHRVHSKIYVVDEHTDDPLAIIGSANCSSRSMTHDSETAAVMFNDKGSPLSFVGKLNARLNYDPETHAIKYEPNSQVADLDIQVYEAIDKITKDNTWYEKIFLRATSIGNLLSTIRSLIPTLKPFIIDVIDPDADNTVPQQEVPERFYEQMTMAETDRMELPVSEKWDEYESLLNEDNRESKYENSQSGEAEEFYHDPGENVISRNESLVDEENNYLGEEEAVQFEDFDSFNEREISRKIEYQAAVVSPVAAKPCEGRGCWAKEILNKEFGISLVINNTIDDAAKKAIGDYQVKYSLSKTGKIDAATERSLLETSALQRTKGTNWEVAATSVIIAAKTKIEDWTKQAVNNKPQYILDSYRDPRKVYAFVLHHMAFKRKSRKTGKYSDPQSYLSTGAHFCIMFDGRIVQLHPESRMIWHAQCISPRSVSVEFEGNFPNIKGNWWIDKDGANRDHPTQEQYEAGRFLASYLKMVMGTTHILAHRQSSDSRENDPGPDIWYNVGQWAVEQLGLTDGGDFKCGDGHPILPQWRTWGKAKEKELNERYETISTEYGMETENFDGMGEASMMEAPQYFEADITDLSKAIALNRSYSTKLGWIKYADKINDLLLPYSGLSNVSLGEEAFARAVQVWQTRNGFSAAQADGIIGPATWARISKALNIVVQPPAPTSGDIQVIDGVQFKKRYNGWDAYGGGDLKTRLLDLKQKNLLQISANELEMFRLVSIPESGGYVNSVNSWDSAYMSMGFIQFTVRYGEMQQVIALVPDTFRKYGIELDPTRLYDKNDKGSIAIKNAPALNDLRSLDWAVKFYKAGLEDDVIIAQIKVGRNILARLLAKYDPHTYLARFADQYPNLWAFIYEANNSRPTPLHEALANAVKKAEAAAVVDSVQFGKILIAELNNSTFNYYNSPARNYSNEEEKKKTIKEELEKVGRIISKTGITH